MAKTPVTREIADQLREKIKQGELGPGALLPSEPELAEQHGVSRQTARTALQLLERDGLIDVQRRRGRTVRSHERLRWRLSDFEHPESTGSSTADAWDTDIADQGATPSFRDFAVQTITPPPTVATILGLSAADDHCICRKRTRCANGHPVVLSQDYFDEQIVRGTELAADEDTQREDILKEAGYEQTYDVDHITARMPDPDEAHKLQLPTGAPVIEHIRAGYTPHGKAVRASVSIVPGDALTLEYVIAT